MKIVEIKNRNMNVRYLSLYIVMVNDRIVEYVLGL